MSLFSEVPVGVIAKTRTPANWATDWEPVYECGTCGVLVRQNAKDKHEEHHRLLDIVQDEASTALRRPYHSPHGGLDA